MQIQKHSLGWLPRASVYNEAKAAAAKRKDASESFIASQSSAMSTFGSIQLGQTQGSINITSQIAAARLGIHLKKSA